MKRKKYIIIFAFTIILLGGCNVNNGETYDNETIEKAKEIAESYLLNNYENITKIEFSDDYNSPMGGLMIRGKVNNGAEFSISMDNSLEIGSISVEKGFPKMKEECKEKACD